MCRCGNWAISFPKRLRYFLLHNSDLANRVIRIAVELIEHQLTPKRPSIGHGPYRCGLFSASFRIEPQCSPAFSCSPICDGVFYKAGDPLHFAEANVTAVDIEQVQEQFRKRHIGFVRTPGACWTRGPRNRWRNGLTAADFPSTGRFASTPLSTIGLERLLRYCARPLYAAGRLQWIVPGESPALTAWPSRGRPAFPSIQHKWRWNAYPFLSFHRRLDGVPANEQSEVTHRTIARLENYRWKKRCSGLYQLPIAA